VINIKVVSLHVFENICVTPQEHTFLKVLPTVDGKELTTEEVSRIAELLSVIRYDFVATVRTPEGYKKILIEIQKAQNALDLMRFRNYLGEQYKRKDNITINGIEIEATLPIITIYLLGFKLPEIDAIVIHVSRTYRDVIAHRELQVKSEFIECLTHDSYVVQIPRIEGKCRNRLEKMLNVFEQKNFSDEKCIFKYYPYDIENEPNEIRLMVEILLHVAADPEKRKEIELEWRSKEFIEDLINTKKTIEEQQQAIEEKDKTIEEQQQAIEEKDKAIEKQKQAIEEKDKAIAEKEREISELKRLYGIKA